MHKIVICWIFMAGFFSCSYSYMRMMYTNTDNGYCEYFNGLLIPVNDYAFDVEKCETIKCEPGKIRIYGCYPVILRPQHPSVSCTLVRGKGILECCRTIPKCKVIGPLPENYAFPKHWIIEDYGNFTQVPNKEGVSEKSKHKEDSAEQNDNDKDSAEQNASDKDSAEQNDNDEDSADDDILKPYGEGYMAEKVEKFENDYEEDSAEDDILKPYGEGYMAEEDEKFENDYEEDSAKKVTFEHDFKKDSAEKDTFKYDDEEDIDEEHKFESEYKEDSDENDKFDEVTTEKIRPEKYEFAEYITEKATTMEDSTKKTQDPLLSEINRYARNYPIS